MLWLALHLPALSLESFAATLGTAQHALPLALLDQHQVRSANRVALRLGIKPGMKRATALALAPQLLFGQADAARDTQALQSVAHAALAFTPSVTLAGNPRDSEQVPVVLLEVQASLRYFGGLARLQQQLREALAPLGFNLQLASAPTPGGAALLARWRDDLNLGPHCRDIERLRALLDDAPVWLLGPGREHWEALQGMGLRTLSDLRHLPRAGLARRFGADLLTDLDRARGQAADPREWLTLPARFESSLELHERADSSEEVLHGAAVLLARLVTWARAQPARIGAFTLALRHEPRRSDETLPTHSELHIALAEASNDAAHLQLLLRERLAQLVLPAPTLELQLRCDQVVRSAAANGELFPTQASTREGAVAPHRAAAGTPGLRARCSARCWSKTTAPNAPPPGSRRWRRCRRHRGSTARCRRARCG